MSIVKQIKQHKIILDTHIFIWLMSGEDVFRPSFLKALEQRRRTNGILISPMSVWEIGMLVEKERIEIGMDPLEWVENSLEAPGFQMTELSSRISINSARLPGKVHGDPVDRILISTAHELNAVLITCDKQILKYGKDRYVDVYNPTKKS